VAEWAGPAQLIYSGGVGQLADLERLAGLRIENLEGVIVGKALYEGRFSIADAHAVLDR
jgi:phosphoribosylformimino-5-aminoimidazole carboxamide ribotide isomerase